MRGAQRITVGVVAIAVSVFVFLVPFIFIVLQAAKDPATAGLLSFSLPTHWQLWQNLVAVLQENDGIVVRAFVNSAVLTVTSVIIMVVFSAMVGYVLQRKPSKLNPWINFLILSGLIVPPAVVPTIWVLQGLNLFKTLPGMILIEATFGLSFCILLFRAFVATIPRELDEAAVIDGASPWRVFRHVILPLSRPALVTTAIFSAIWTWNDFFRQLVYLSDLKDYTAPVALTLFIDSTSEASVGPMFAMSLVSLVPVFLFFIAFQRLLVEGINTSGLKG